jgi:hypothetical protein
MAVVNEEAIDEFYLNATEKIVTQSTDLSIIFQYSEMCQIQT